jgi:putative transcriptional regulator
MGAVTTLRPIQPDRGTFLIASPRLLDPNFMHAVVLLCAHGAEGSYGLIVNRQGDMTVEDLESDSVLLAGRRDPIWAGGPVQMETLQILHRLGSEIPGALHIVDDVHLGGDAPVVRALIEKRQPLPEQMKFVLGYAGWGAGQLEQELEQGSWIVTTADADLVFDPSPRKVWRRALRALGEPYAPLADEPPDPSWN